MGLAINYLSTLVVGAATLTGGDTSRTAPAAGNVGTIFNNANGGMVERITVTPLATTVPSVVRIFRFDGVSYHLYTEIPLPAQTVTLSGAVNAVSLQAVDYPGLFPILIPPGWSLRTTVNDAQTGIKVQAEGGGS